MRQDTNVKLNQTTFIYMAIMYKIQTIILMSILLLLYCYFTYMASNYKLELSIKLCLVEYCSFITANRLISFSSVAF